MVPSPLRKRVLDHGTPKLTRTSLLITGERQANDHHGGNTVRPRTARSSPRPRQAPSDPANLKRTPRSDGVLVGVNIIARKEMIVMPIRGGSVQQR